MIGLVIVLLLVMGLYVELHILRKSMKNLMAENKAIILTNRRIWLESLDNDEYVLDPPTSQNITPAETPESKATERASKTSSDRIKAIQEELLKAIGQIKK